ncbi:hypothetical protein OV203_12605 [Nannocystis sp. ILAH1]|uniref:hypothetical protein n=1 Tax=unclassified Nannocystis TaxID=2627009 RepID=UPI002270524B|nr:MULTISPECIES: hypothetical protein [unclassified Nannocystis]MCY0987971.1 hypothetical protein [Nannocystis sp. ILAH1]MCY1065686.1 hypothetical protein [Nannocystis sp. RBIL2]
MRLNDLNILAQILAALAVAAACGESSDETTGDSGTGGSTASMETVGASTATTGGSTAGSSTAPTEGGGSDGETTGTTAPATVSSDGGNNCDGFVQPGCVSNACPEGQYCEFEFGCAPSSCDCTVSPPVCADDCEGGTCIDVEDARCQLGACDLYCEFGFMEGDDGCPICACAPPPGCLCQTDADCVRITFGCCDCALGGLELAVAEQCVDTFEACTPPSEADADTCAGADQCTDRQPACVAQKCVLQ